MPVYSVPGLGNIPAYAGKAEIRFMKWSEVKKHPRIRGESPLSFDRLTDMPETSPHTRGKPRLIHSRWIAGRNIPAYAGKAILEDSHLETTQKHPRIRRESSLFIDK